MNKPKKECGSCINWTKWKFDPWGRGLCDFLDAAGKAEHGKNCPYWKGKKYKRQKHDYINDNFMSQ
jgi:hypothetical protein